MSGREGEVNLPAFAWLAHSGWLMWRTASGLALAQVWQDGWTRAGTSRCLHTTGTDLYLAVKSVYQNGIYQC